MTTWKELQETCLRKLFSLDEKDLVRDSNTNPYLNSMPAAANEALDILATAGRYFKKCLTIRQGQGADTGTPIGSWMAYDLKELTADYYCLGEVKLESGTAYGIYHGYAMEGDRMLLLPAEETGTFRIWYNAYAPRITKDTPEDFVLDLHPEALSMVALYMAGQLYKDDDISIAQIYMNEFMVWLEELKESARRAAGRNSGGGWHSKTGWW